MQILEFISDYFNRVQTIINQMSRNREEIDEIRIMEKITKTVNSKFKYIIFEIQESKDLSNISIYELQGSLQVYDKDLYTRINQGENLRKHCRAI